jgi:NAD(P)-dependent dehydrogenase (short-subunit alcohol dehydrogenase family)
VAKTPKSLVGTVVAITGGARGIGRATAAALIAQGARVAIGDVDESLVQKTAAELAAGTIGLPLDVTDRGSFDAFLNEVESRLGPLDVLVNNAGIMPIGPFVDETDATTARLVAINLNGVILGTKLALQRFLPRRRGHVVNIASIAGKAGAPNGATYAATKHAVVGLTESLRAELRGSGVDFTMVMPIGVNTELYSGAKQIRGFRTPEPEDVARAIVEALQTGRSDVYVPRMMNPLVRSGALMPRAWFEAISRWLGANRALANPDHAARAAYEARIAEMVSGAEADEAQPADEHESAVPTH